jgi:thiamine transport system permease protein
VDGRRAALGRAALLALPLAFLALFFVYPLVRIVGTGLRSGGGIGVGAVAEVLGDPALRGVIGFTVIQAALSTILTMAIGLPLAYVLARMRFPGRTVVGAVVLLPFVLPTVVVGLAFGGGRGSWTALLAAHAFFNVAVVVRVVGGAWEAVDPAVEDAAEELGARGWRRVTAVMLPLARPAIAGAATLVALFTFTSFGAALLLAPPGRATIEVEIWRQTTSFLDLRTASALVLIQAACTFAVLALEARAAGRSVVASAPGALPRSPRTRGERVFLWVTVAGSLLFVATPLLRLLARSVTSDAGLTLDRYLHLGQARPGGLFALDPASAIATSLRTSTAATAIALAVGLPAAFGLAGATRSGRLSRLLSAVPLGVSAVAVGLGYVIAFRDPPLDLRSSWVLVPLAQALVALPFVLRIVGPTAAAIRRDLAEQAAALGASPAQTFRDVTVPVAAPAIGTAAAFAFAVSLGEFGATTFLARADAPTMPVAIVRLLGQPGAASIGQAYAMATLLMLVTTAAALVLRGGAARLAEG